MDVRIHHGDHSIFPCRSAPILSLIFSSSRSHSLPVGAHPPPVLYLKHPQYHSSTHFQLPIPVSTVHTSIPYLLFCFTVQISYNQSSYYLRIGQKHPLSPRPCSPPSPLQRIVLQYPLSSTFNPSPSPSPQTSPAAYSSKTSHSPSRTRPAPPLPPSAAPCPHAIRIFDTVYTTTTGPRSRSPAVSPETSPL